MIGLGRRLLRLFVDSVWLAVAALCCVAGAGMAVRVGAPRGLAAGAMLAGLVCALVVSVRSAMRPLDA